MRLYILRHAEAEDRGPGQQDVDRPLTARGHQQAREVAAAFASGENPLEVRPMRIISSRALRATQTATVVANALGLDVEFDDDLGTDAVAHDVAKLLQPLRDFAAVVIVGHNPTLADLAGQYGGESTLRKAEVAVFEVHTVGHTETSPVGRFRPEA